MLLFLRKSGRQRETGRERQRQRDRVRVRHRERDREEGETERQKKREISHFLGEMRKDRKYILLTEF